MNTRKVKITAAQIIALRSADMSVDGMYAVGTAKGQTVSALIRAGIVVPGTRLLTVQGVSVMHTVSHVDVIASKGHTVYVSDAPESLATFVLPPRTEGVEESATDATGDAENGAQSVDGGTVEIQGAEGFDMTPDMSALTGECYMGCGRPVTGMFTDYVGRTEGVCDFDRSSLGDHITVVPVHPSVWGGGQSDDTERVTVPTVCVVQNTPGMNGRSHYHAPGCRDVAREMRHWGQDMSDVTEFAFESVAEILTFEYGDIASDSAPVDTPEWWSEIISNAQIDASDVNGFGVKIMPCLDIPAGRAGKGPLVTQGGFYRVGFDRPSAERVAEIKAEIAAHTCDEFECLWCTMNALDGKPINSHNLSEHIEMEKGMSYECDTCRSVGMLGEFKGFACEGPWIDAECGCERFANPLDVPCPDHAGKAVTEDDTDGGFVETMVTKEYELSVIVDETTGTRVSLGWVTLEMNAAQCMDFDRVAEEYGRTQNTRTPRHGWASIITVHNVCDL